MNKSTNFELLLHNLHNICIHTDYRVRNTVRRTVKYGANLQDAIDKINVWIDEKNDVMKAFVDLPMDKDKLDRLLGEHEVTVRDIDDKKPEVEDVIAKGNLIVDATKHPGL